MLIKRKFRWSGDTVFAEGGLRTTPTRNQPEANVKQVLTGCTKLNKIKGKSWLVTLMSLAGSQKMKI